MQRSSHDDTILMAEWLVTGVIHEGVMQGHGCGWYWEGLDGVYIDLNQNVDLLVYLKVLSGHVLLS